MDTEARLHISLLLYMSTLQNGSGKYRNKQSHEDLLPSTSTATPHPLLPPGIGNPGRSEFSGSGGQKSKTLLLVPGMGSE